MRYRNTSTGAIIDSPCTISGGDWVEYTNEAKEIIEEIEDEVEEIIEVEEAASKAEVEPKDEEGFEGFDGITVKEIKQELDAFGIKYNPRAKKQELYDLMIKGG